MSDIENYIGNTPLILIDEIGSNKIYGKLEGNNPAGSIKDRPAIRMIKDAEQAGFIKKGDTLIEATSGNTGIALAMAASIRGFKIKLIMPETASIERVKTMKAYGAKVTLTPEAVGIEGARDYATEKVEQQGYYSFNQFANDDNWKAHYHTTGPELWNDTDGNITHFVSSMGTTGTIMGTSSFLKEQNESIQIIGVQPGDGYRIPGIRKWPMEYLPKIFNADKVDQIIEVSSNEAKETAKLLAQKEGIFGGMSSGGAVCAALKLIETLDSGIVAVIICDRGDRYLSSDLFE